jgi:two-component sensor histidine kinase
MSNDTSAILSPPYIAAAWKGIYSRMRRDEGGKRPAELLLAVQMQELRHRLSNHLQNMISLISLQVRRAQHPETVAALEDLRTRFSTLTSIYIDLDEASDLPIALDQFIPDLVRRVGELYDPNGRHAISTTIAPCTLAGPRAAILGQIVVELVMNVYRHAFAARIGGTIDVALTQDEEQASLRIADDGPGLVEPDGSRTHLGFDIISNLARALGGTFAHESRGGFIARLRFPLDSGAEPP